MFVSFSNLGSFGRLGNQMFQYALIKSVAHKNNCEYKIPKGNYELLKLNINKNFLDKKPNNIFYEKDFSFDPHHARIFEDTDYEGYFQSPKYFSYDLIRDDFTVSNMDQHKNKINNLRQKYNKEIVSIHIRRTDYLNFPKVHPFPGLHYYKKAMDRFSDCMFLVFSDDINYCKSTLNKPSVLFESNDTITDLFLMSNCDHNIIANSSFSWWAAYLNTNKNKKVIYPAVWFGPNGPSNWSDLIPEGWEKCSNAN